MKEVMKKVEFATLTRWRKDAAKYRAAAERLEAKGQMHDAAERRETAAFIEEEVARAADPEELHRALATCEGRLADAATDAQRAALAAEAEALAELLEHVLHHQAQEAAANLDTSFVRSVLVGHAGESVLDAPRPKPAA